MGASGRGKSTLAAAFASTGYRFLTDDGLLLEPGDPPRIVPSPPSLRLWDDSRAALLAGAPGTATPYSAKMRLLAGDAIPHCPQPRMLHQVYFLGEARASTPTIVALPPAEAVIELVRHSFLIDVEAQDVLAAHFGGLASVANGVAFFRLDYPRRFGELPRLREAIVAHSSCGPRSDVDVRHGP